MTNLPHENARPLAVIMTCVYQKDKPNQVKTMIDSLLRQSYPNIIILLHIDGPVPDELMATIMECHLREPSKIKITSSKKNQGLARSLNILIESAVQINPKYYARMDADDISLKKRIEKQIAFMENNDLDISGTACREFGSASSKIRVEMPIGRNEIIDCLMLRTPFIHPSVVMRDRIFNAGLRYPEIFDKKEDIAFWGTVLAAGFSASNMTERLILYRMTDETISRRSGILAFQTEFAVRIRNARLLRKGSIYNYAQILLKCLIRLLPHPVIRFLYKVAR